MARAEQRLRKEYQIMTQTMAEIFHVELLQGGDLFHWSISFTMRDGIYVDESYTLDFKFPNTFPIEAPVVVFSGLHPEHEHIYSNGFICLAILYDDWSPSLRVSSIVFSIMTMLSTTHHKRRPSNDEEFTRFARGKTPKQIKWIYD